MSLQREEQSKQPHWSMRCPSTWLVWPQTRAKISLDLQKGSFWWRQEKLCDWTEFRAWLNNIISEVNMQLGNKCPSWASQNASLVLAMLEKPIQSGLWPHPSPDAVIARIWTCCCHRSWWKRLARCEGMGGLNRGKWIKSSVSSKKMVTSQIVFKNYFNFSGQRLPQISLKSPAEGEWFEIMLSGDKSIGFSKAVQRGPACHGKVLIKTKQPRKWLMFTK